MANKDVPLFRVPRIRLGQKSFHPKEAQEQHLQREITTLTSEARMENKPNKRERVEEGYKGTPLPTTSQTNNPKIVPPQGGSGTAPPQGQNKPKK